MTLIRRSANDKFESLINLNYEVMFKMIFIGSPLPMGILTLVFLAMLISMVLALLNRQSDLRTKRIKYLEIGKAIGLFALVLGIFFQLIGFYMAFERLEMVGEVSPGVLFGGLKYSMITTIYGAGIFLVSRLLWFMLYSKSSRLLKVDQSES